MVWRAIQLFGIKEIFSVQMLILAPFLFPEDFGLFAIASGARPTLPCCGGPHQYAMSRLFYAIK